MGTKNNPGEFDCYANAEPDEPILLGRDPHGHAAVRKWANDREQMIRAGAKPYELWPHLFSTPPSPLETSGP